MDNVTNQNAALTNFMAITNLDRTTCEMLLSQCGWDYELAVRNMYDPPSASQNNDVVTNMVEGPSPQEPNMLTFNCTRGRVRKQFILDDTHSVDDLKGLIAAELDIPLENVLFRNWPRSPPVSYTNSQSMSRLSLPQVNEVVLNDSNVTATFDLTNSSDLSGGGQVDMDLEHLTKQYVITVRNMEDNVKHELICQGSETVGDIKLQAFNLTNIAPVMQEWGPSRSKFDDDNSTVSSLLHGLNSELFTIRKKPSAATTSSAAMSSSRLNNITASTANSAAANTSTAATNGRAGSRQQPQLIDDDSSSSDDETDFDTDDVYDPYMDVNVNGHDDVVSSYDKANGKLMPDVVENEKDALEQFQNVFKTRYSSYGPGPDFKVLSLQELIHEGFGGPARSRKMLAIYLHHEKSIQANIFCSQILCKEATSTFLNEHFLSWGWDLTSDANKKRFLGLCEPHFGSGCVDQLNRIKVDSFPVVMVVKGKGRTCEVVGILQGGTDIDELMASLMSHRDRHENEREIDIREEMERQQRENLLLEQKEAYQKSLEIDRQKRIKKEEAERRVESELRRKQNAEERKQEEIARLCSLIPGEPSDNTGEKLCHIRFRPVSGQIFNRQFLQSDKVQSLVDFVGSKGYLPTEYKIFRGYPKTCISCLDMAKSLSEIGLGRREAVTIEEIDTDANNSD